jgi:hypothetical protein
MILIVHWSCRGSLSFSNKFTTKFSKQALPTDFCIHVDNYKYNNVDIYKWFVKITWPDFLSDNAIQTKKSVESPPTRKRMTMTDTLNVHRSVLSRKSCTHGATSWTPRDNTYRKSSPT